MKDPFDKKQLTKRLKAFFCDSKMSQKDLSKKMGVNPNKLSKWLNIEQPIGFPDNKKVSTYLEERGY